MYSSLWSFGSMLTIPNPGYSWESRGPVISASIYSSGPDYMPFILCQIDFMPFFSREHNFIFFYADFPLSSHKRHKIRIYAGSAYKRTPNFVPVRHEIGPLLRRTGMCFRFFLCPEISLTCELVASEAQTRHSKL